jgi:hypothetical protein
MGGEAAVQVAVRIRPFNGRETAMNAKRCIDMEGPNTMIYEEDGTLVAGSIHPSPLLPTLLFVCS